MANIQSARKRALQAVARNQRNRSRMSRIRGFIRKVEEAIKLKDGTVARAALKVAEPEIMRGVTKGVLHHNTASRKVSRLACRVNAL